MWITYQNCSYYLDKLGYIEKDRLKGNLPFSSGGNSIYLKNQSKYRIVVKK